VKKEVVDSCSMWQELDEKMFNQPCDFSAMLYDLGVTQERIDRLESLGIIIAAITDENNLYLHTLLETPANRYLKLINNEDIPDEQKAERWQRFYNDACSLEVDHFRAQWPELF
jgi:hypothetical protein